VNLRRGLIPLLKKLLGILTLGTGLAVRLMASARNAASRAVMRMPRSVIVVDIGEPPV
jgi:hypothetical protein